MPKLQLLAFATLLFSLLSFLSTEAKGDEEPACHEHLNLIYEGLRRHLKEKGRYPDKLGDLAGAFVPERCLTCPKALGKLKSPGNGEVTEADSDPLTSYQYDYSTESVADRLVAERINTFREWKYLQVELYNNHDPSLGSKVPVVRCSEHGEEFLNLDFKGRIYKSGLYWECCPEFLSVISANYASTEAVSKSTQPIIKRLPKRPQQLSGTVLSLDSFYTALPADHWIAARSGQSLAGLASPAKHGDIEFDTRGVVQLNGGGFGHPTYPIAAKGIPVGRTVQAITFLHAAAFCDPGAIAGYYELQFVEPDAKIVRIDLIGGKTIGNWLTTEKHPLQQELPRDLETVWTKKLQKGKSARLFAYTWSSGKPRNIKSIDFVSSGGRAAPFLVSIVVHP